MLFIALAGVIIPLFTGPEYTPELDALAVGLSRVLFPIVVLLGLNGLLVGILNAYDHFTIPALAPLVWNLVIIAGLVVLKPLFEGPDELYAYAIGVLAGTVVQFAMAIPPLRRVGFRLSISFHWRDQRVRQILQADAAGDDRARADQLQPADQHDARLPRLRGGAGGDRPRVPHLHAAPGHVLRRGRDGAVPGALAGWPRAATIDGLRHTSANGVRQIALLLIPAAAATLALATPITRLVYERGTFDAESTEQVSEALFWFSFSLPFSGANLLLTRTFFSLQQPWTPTALAGADAGRQRRGLRRAVRPAGDRRRRHRHRGGQRGDDGRPGVLPAAPAGRHRARHDPAARSCGMLAAAAAAGRRRLRRLVGARRGARALAGWRRSSRSAAGSPRARSPTRPIVLALRIPEARQIVQLLGSRIGRGSA